MKTEMNQNSLTAYEIYKSKFKGDKMKIIDELLKNSDGLTAYQLSLRTKIALGTVCGRLNDLKKCNAIKVLEFKNYRTKAPESIYVMNYDLDSIVEPVKEKKFKFSEVKEILESEKAKYIFRNYDFFHQYTSEVLTLFKK